MDKALLTEEEKENMTDLERLEYHCKQETLFGDGAALSQFISHTMPYEWFQSSQFNKDDDGSRLLLFPVRVPAFIVNLAIKSQEIDPTYNSDKLLQDLAAFIYVAGLGALARMDNEDDEEGTPQESQYK